MSNPSEKVHDRYRSVSGGNVSIPVNSRRLNDPAYVDQSRLGVHEEWDPDAKNDWGGTGKMVETPNNVRLNAIGAMGDICAKSSNRNPENEVRDTGAGPRCTPVLYPPNSTNPMYRRRKGE